MSQILTFVSSEPDAKKFPDGWKSTLMQFERCPVRVRTTAREGDATGRHVVSERSLPCSGARQGARFPSAPFPSGNVFSDALRDQFGIHSLQESHGRVPDAAPATTFSSAMSKGTSSLTSLLSTEIVALISHVPGVKKQHVVVEIPYQSILVRQAKCSLAHSLTCSLNDKVATYQDRTGLANCPHVHLLVLATGDHHRRGLASNLQAVDRAGVRHKLLCEMVKEFLHEIAKERYKTCARRSWTTPRRTGTQVSFVVRNAMPYSNSGTLTIGMW
eukprot:1185497-Prorocentrum_minimum.AAC.4